LRHLAVGGVLPCAETVLCPPARGPGWGRWLATAARGRYRPGRRPAGRPGRRPRCCGHRLRRLRESPPGGPRKGRRQSARGGGADTRGLLPQQVQRQGRPRLAEAGTAAAGAGVLAPAGLRRRPVAAVRPCPSAARRGFPPHRTSPAAGLSGRREGNMDHALIPLKLDLSTQRLGRPQPSWAMTVLPVFSPGTTSKLTPPPTCL